MKYYPSPARLAEWIVGKDYNKLFRHSKKNQFTKSMRTSQVGEIWGISLEC